LALIYWHFVDIIWIFLFIFIYFLNNYNVVTCYSYLDQDAVLFLV
jgi:hypothetical protein